MGIPNSWDMSFLREIWWLEVATPLFGLAIVAELLISNWRMLGVYTLKGFTENVLLSLANLGLDIFLRGVALMVLDQVFDWRLISWAEGGLLYWTVLLFAEDFVYYWLHRVDHQCRLFWAVHVTHHSSEEFNLSVGFRSSVFQPFYRFFYFIPLALLGFRAIDIYLIYALTQLYGILIHTQLINRLGILEKILVTPSHHRVHHASNARYLDRNLGMVFILWDKLFGTFTPETEKAKYGLTKPFLSSHKLSVVSHEWEQMLEDVRRSASWRDRFRYVFGAPGWRHDGVGHTSAELRARASVANNWDQSEGRSNGS